jgi:hypothetical protein
MKNHKIDEHKDKIRRMMETIENTQDSIEFAILKEKNGKKENG